ncbi:MAG: DsbA family protein [Myxococcota bacterium]
MAKRGGGETDVGDESECLAASGANGDARAPGGPPANLPGGASRQDRSPREREIQRLLMLALPRLRRIDAGRRELVRRLRRAPHEIELFHQVDDPYSQLALEAIPRLAERYAVRFRFHLVPPTDRLHAPEPERLAAWARRDCAAVAPHYGLPFASDGGAPEAGAVRDVQRWLAGRLERSDFVADAIAAGRTLFNRGADLQATRDRIARDLEADRAASPTDTDRLLARGEALRAKRRHYSGGMYWHAGDWYWGVDRLYHLERRLCALGASRAPDAPLCFPRPPLDPGPIRDDGRLTLEIFPSLRSPYTAMIFEKSLALAREAGVAVVLRPVMPMVMRGVPAPAAKGIYIMLDAKREADALGVPFGNMYDPIGKAVLRGFSLWPFARSHGREAEYIAAFLRAAFVEGKPTGTDDGLRQVVERAGLDWREALPFVDSIDCLEELEANRRLLYEELGLWGVPSYRLRGPGSGPASEPDLGVWGQDRLWLVAAEIRRRLAR